jgi:ferrous iron transport protein B
LYVPCIAAISAIYRETNLRWTLFACAWAAAMAYMAATLFYQAATIGRHPASSLTWIAVIGVLFAAAVLIMRYAGQQRPATVPALMRGAQA